MPEAFARFATVPVPVVPGLSDGARLEAMLHLLPAAVLSLEEPGLPVPVSRLAAPGPSARPLRAGAGGPAGGVTGPRAGVS